MSTVFCLFSWICILCLTFSNKILMFISLVFIILVHSIILTMILWYHLYHGEYSKELFDPIPAASFRRRPTDWQHFHPHHIDGWQATTVRDSRNFLRAPQNCGISCCRRYFWLLSHKKIDGWISTPGYSLVVLILYNQVKILTSNYKFETRSPHWKSVVINGQIFSLWEEA